METLETRSAIIVFKGSAESALRATQHLEGTREFDHCRKLVSLDLAELTGQRSGVWGSMGSIEFVRGRELVLVAVLCFSMVLATSAGKFTDNFIPYNTDYHVQSLNNGDQAKLVLDHYAGKLSFPLKCIAAVLACCWDIRDSRRLLYIVCSTHQATC